MPGRPRYAICPSSHAEKRRCAPWTSGSSAMLGVDGGLWAATDDAKAQPTATRRARDASRNMKSSGIRPDKPSRGETESSSRPREPTELPRDRDLPTPENSEGAGSLSFNDPAPSIPSERQL